MNPLRRKGIAENEVEALAGEIAAGRLSGNLPSSRHLANLLGVSRPVLLRALQELETRGVIGKSGPRQTYVVAKPGKAAWQAPAGQERHALYILDEEVVRHDAFEILLSLAMQMHGKGWRISSLRMNFGHNESRPRQWQRAVAGYAPDKVLVWSGRPQLAEWLYRNQLPSMFIGGDNGGTPISVVGTSGTQAIRLLLDEFLRHGHERIWLPLCNRPEGYAENLRETMRAVFDARGIPFFSRHHTPTSPYRGPDVIIAMFEEAWRVHRPTALILHDWREYVALSAVLRREGLDIPKHMSVALIGDDPEMEWHRPGLAHFRAPLKRLASSCAAWLNSAPPQVAVKSLFFEAEWVPGESIAKPRSDC